MTKALERLRIIYDAYVKDALDQDQPRFWFLFCGSVALSCAGFYFYTFWVEGFLDLSVQKFLGKAVIIFCIILPSLVLRRLTYLAIAAILVFGFFTLKNYLLDLLFQGEQSSVRFTSDILFFCLIGLLVRKLGLSSPLSSKL
ncbi:hypothetical protein [Spirosoma pomorum]